MFEFFGKNLHCPLSHSVCQGMCSFVKRLLRMGENISECMDASAVTCLHSQGDTNVNQWKAGSAKPNVLQASNINQCQATLSTIHLLCTAASAVAFTHHSTFINLFFQHRLWLANNGMVMSDVDILYRS